MKVVIFAGGLGSRLSEETGVRPKPMIEIGGRPILWHIMKIYSYYGFNEFVILTGYLSHVIKDYFINYYTRYSDITIDMSNQNISLHKMRQEPWIVTMLYTGEITMTGSRLKKAEEYIGNETFLLTYGDGVGDVNIPELIKQHRMNKKITTITAVQPEGKFGALSIDKNGNINSFQEKPKGDGSWINAGFMVCEPKIFDYIEKDREDIVFESGPLRKLSDAGELAAYKHEGFWHPMDTLKNKIDLERMWIRDEAPWALWNMA